MATLFTNQRIGTWVGSIPLYGTLTGDITRSGNVVTLSNLKITVNSNAPVSGQKTLGFYCNNVGSSLPLMGSGTTNLGTYSVNGSSIGVQAAQTSANVIWSSSDGFNGSFTITFPAPPSTPSLTVTTLSHNTIEITYGVSSYGSPSTGTLKLYGDTGETPTTEIDGINTTGSKKYIFTDLEPSTTYYFKATANNTKMSASSSIKSATTASEPSFYVPVNGVAKKAVKLYCSVNGKTKLVEKLYGSVNGETKQVL